MRIPVWSDERQLTAALAQHFAMGDLVLEECGTLRGGELKARLQEGGPTAIDVGKCGFAGVLRVRKGEVELLDSDYSVKTIPLDSLVDRLLEAAAGDELAQVE